MPIQCRKILIAVVVTYFSSFNNDIFHQITKLGLKDFRERCVITRRNNVCADETLVHPGRASSEIVKNI